MVRQKCRTCNSLSFWARGTNWFWKKFHNTFLRNEISSKTFSLFSIIQNFSSENCWISSIVLIFKNYAFLNSTRYQSDKRRWKVDLYMIRSSNHIEKDNFRKTQQRWNLAYRFFELCLLQCRKVESKIYRDIRLIFPCYITFSNWIII